MVVLSAAITSKTKTLLARQFVEMSRLRIESLLSAFIRLIESGSQDHTYIETDSVRFVYLPIESLYLILITNKGSNILEDLETLKLMQQIVQNCCESSVNEDTVLTQAFDIVFSFDEVISFGHRESVTLNQISIYTEMESQDEKLSVMIMQSKMKEEKKRAAAIAARLEKQRAEQKKREKARLKQERALGRSFLSSSSTTAPVPTDIGGISPLLSDDIRPIDSTAAVDPFAAAGLQQAPQRGMQIGRKTNMGDLLSSLRPAGARVGQNTLDSDVSGL